MAPHPLPAPQPSRQAGDPLPALDVPVLLKQRGERDREGAMPFLMSFALEPEIVTLAWTDNASVQFPLNINTTKA